MYSHITVYNVSPHRIAAMLKFLVLTLIFVGFGEACDYDVGDFLKSQDLDVNETAFEDLPKPEDVDSILDDECFEQYLNFWQKKQYEPRQKDTLNYNVGCAVNLRSLTEPSPVFEFKNDLKYPHGNSGNLMFADGDSVVASCKGNGLVYPSAAQNPVQATITCRSGSFTALEWLTGTIIFEDIKCTDHVAPIEIKGVSCANGQGVKINIAVQSNTVQFPIITSCFKESTSEVLYVEYKQGAEHLINQSAGRLQFQQGPWYPGLAVNNLYKQVVQKQNIKIILGAIDKYINKTFYLTRGHLAAKTDFPLSPSQRATFTFINAAPQWNTFNSGNWEVLETSLRHHIGDTNRNTTIYTGTWDILRLKDIDGNLKEIFLSPLDRRIPVPLWYFKVVHEPSTNRATAFIGLNNPHATLAEAEELAFCNNICKKDQGFGWLKWNSVNVTAGYSICCEVNDFKRTINTLPMFDVNGILD